MALTQEQVVAQFEAIKKVKEKGYTFKNFIYYGDKKKSLITCNVKDHGDFLITPHNLKAGKGCQKCGRLNAKVTINGYQPDYVKQLSLVDSHKNKNYLFHKTKYISSRLEVCITCPIENHGDFYITPKVFKKGVGCPKCSKGGFKRNKPAIFYYVRVNKDGCEVYKPGITNNTVKKRYPKDFAFMTVLRTIEFESGQEAYDFEQSVLNDYAYAKWTGIPLLQNNGNTELMKYDILDWDN